MTDLFERHDRVAFQFSGGRDSLAALYLLALRWGEFTVYHIDSGDQFPETRAVVDRVAAQLPNFVRLRGDSQAIRFQYGMPSDVVPTGNTAFGRRVSGSPLLLQDRYDCCFRSVMLPMYQRMKADGVTAIIRGVRKDDFKKAPTEHGDVVDGFEFHYPIWDWSESDVMEFLEDSGVEPAPFYKHGLRETLECVGCTAWWDNDRSRYMQRFHPKAYLRYADNLRRIKVAVQQQMKTLDTELEVTHG
jgi:phosphoadenosine phosphosulfate reductase